MTIEKPKKEKLKEEKVVNIEKHMVNPSVKMKYYDKNGIIKDGVDNTKLFITDDKEIEGDILFQIDA